MGCTKFGEQWDKSADDLMVDAYLEAIKDAGVETKDIEYGKVGDRALLLDLYAPEKIEKPVPGLIFIHGGGWESGNRSDYQNYTGRYAKRGYVVATISYRFSGEAPFPGCVQDAKCAVRWMRANAAELKVDPDRIAVIGGSAGGYLSLMVGYTAGDKRVEGTGGHQGVSSAVQAVVDLYGPTDFDTPIGRASDTVRDFLGKRFEDDPELYRFASPINHVDAKDPPTFVLQGSIDSTVPVEQSDMLVEKLKSLGVGTGTIGSTAGRTRWTWPSRSMSGPNGS